MRRNQNKKSQAYMEARISRNIMISMTLDQFQNFLKTSLGLPKSVRVCIIYIWIKMCLQEVCQRREEFNVYIRACSWYHHKKCSKAVSIWGTYIITILYRTNNIPIWYPISKIWTFNHFIKYVLSLALFHQN